MSDVTVVFKDEGVEVTKRTIHEHGSYTARYKHRCPCGVCRHGRKRGPEGTPGLREAARAVAKKKRTARDVAEEFGVSRSRVHQLAKEEGS